MARIVTGQIPFTFQDQLYILGQPSLSTHVIAVELYEEALKEGYWSGMLAEEEVVPILMSKGLWTEEDEKQLKTALENLDKLKIGLYEARFKSILRDKTRRYIHATRQTIRELTAKKSILDYATAEGAASSIRMKYLVANSVYLPDGSPLLLWESDSSLFEVALQTYITNQLDESSLRELARTAPWRVTWNCRKATSYVFSPDAINLTNDQRALISWSSLYDNIMESDERPSNEELEDDDMVDGWLLIQQRKADAHRAKILKDNFTSNPKIREASEVFIPADTMEDAKKIYDMNESNAERIRKQRLRYLHKQEVVPEGKMPDTQLELQMQWARMEAAAIKGK